MPLIARFAAFALLSLAPALAHAATHEDDADDNDSDVEAKPAATAEAPHGESVAVTGLVPLKELNRRPYEGMWFADFRFHNYGIGLSLEQINVSLSSPTTLVDNGVSSPASDTTSDRLDCGGVFGNYWLPLIGYSTEFSAGLLPGVKLQIGADDSGVDTAVELPVFAMARIGRNASRYANWPVALGAGVGFDLVHFSGGPDPSSQTYLAPDVRFELGYGMFQLGYEAELGSHSKSFGANSTISYSTNVFTLGVVVQPEPDE